MTRHEQGQCKGWKGWAKLGSTGGDSNGLEHRIDRLEMKISLRVVALPKRLLPICVVYG